MELMPVGVVAILLALATIIRPLSIGMTVYGVFMVMPVAAAVNLPALGGASIQCSRVISLALFLAVILRPRMMSQYLRHITQNKPVIIFSLFVVYSVITAIYWPLLFGGEVDVYSINRGDSGGGLSKLVGSTGHITQSAYLIGDLVFFSVLTFIFLSRDAVLSVQRVFNAATVTMIFFGVLSMVPSNPITSATLEFVRTANYAILTGHQISGYTRVIGSMTEASVYGSAAVVFFTYNFVRFVQTRSVFHGLASILLLAGVVLSFSTTGYAALLVMVLVWSLKTTSSLVLKGLSAEDLTAVFVSALAASIVILILFVEPVQLAAIDVLNSLFGEKLISDSGRERGAWNEQALRNFTETFGLGVGLGSARASSQILAVISNLGLIGFLLFVAFVFTLVHRRGYRYARFFDKDALVNKQFASAAMAALVAEYSAQVISGTMVGPGMILLTLGAAASGLWPNAPQRVRAPLADYYADVIRTRSMPVTPQDLKLAS
ncbi:MAG: hypothetical protein AAFR21_11910 [Pseudomonadota bacterium]